MSFDQQLHTLCIVNYSYYIVRIYILDKIDRKNLQKNSSSP